MRGLNMTNKRDKNNYLSWPEMAEKLNFVLFWNKIISRKYSKINHIGVSLNLF
jgi:hypothetical protein